MEKAQEKGEGLYSIPFINLNTIFQAREKTVLHSIQLEDFIIRCFIILF